MRFVNKCTFAVVVFFFLAVSAAEAQVADMAQELWQAHQSGKLIPVLSVDYPQLDVDMAYEVQKAFVEKMLVDDEVAGYKAGLTSKAGQDRFGVDAPLAGVLPASGKLADQTTIDSSGFHMAMLETEIGFVLGETVTEPLKNTSALQAHIRGVVPVIEVPDLGFADMKKLTGSDIIAANVSAKQFVLGEEQTAGDLDLNNLEVKLSLDGLVVNTGRGSDAMGDQWEAALWLINTSLEQGWDLKPGQVVISGALGKMIPGKPGKYEADFGGLGRLRFTIK